MADLLDPLLRASPILVYAVITFLVLAESALFIGFLLPGEASVLLGGMLAATGRLDLPVFMMLVIAAAIVGDAVGFWVGRRYGPWLLRRKTLVRHQGRTDRIRDFLRRRGGWAVLVGRFTAILRAMTPPLAGLSGMSWRTFVTFDVLGGIVWAGGVALLGFVAGRSYQEVAHTMGDVSTGLLVLVAIAGLVAWHRSRRSRMQAR